MGGVAIVIGKVNTDVSLAVRRGARTPLYSSRQRSPSFQTRPLAVTSACAAEASQRRMRGADSDLDACLQLQQQQQKETSTRNLTFPVRAARVIASFSRSVRSCTDHENLPTRASSRTWKAPGCRGDIRVADRRVPHERQLTLPSPTTSASMAATSGGRTTLKRFRTSRRHNNHTSERERKQERVHRGGRFDDLAASAGCLSGRRCRFPRAALGRPLARGM
jgi:hypothetical protein